VIVNLYGRERHPEFTQSEGFDEETYAARRERALLMEKTFSYVEKGVRPDNHFLLIEEDTLNLTERTGSGSTTVTHSMGMGPQFGMVVDLTGRIIHFKNWERPEQHDEVLSAIFGVAPGL
jgi:hypothetical protein